MISVVLLLIVLLIKWLYRSPTIIIPTDPNIIISPTFGKVQKIENNRIEIILDILDPHVQYFPIDGVIKNQEYITGTFTPVISKYFEKTDNNERLIHTLDDLNGNIVKVTQYGGILFNRIVKYKNIGDTFKKGDTLGMIKLGSRVDIDLPLQDVRIIVKEGDYVRGGQPLAHKLIKYNE